MAVIDLTAENFEKTINGKGIVLVDFWASWCGPCQMQGPVVEELADAHQEICVGKVNVDKEGSLVVQFHVSNIPSLLFFKDGDLVKKEIGFHSREELEEILSAL